MNIDGWCDIISPLQIKEKCTMDKFIQYTDFILAIGVMLLWLTIVVLIVVAWVGSLIARNRFFKSAEKSLKFRSVVESMKGITNDFEVYRNHRFGFKSKSIVELCQELGQKLKLKEDSEDILKLEEIISLFKDEYRFDDEKMNEVIKNIESKSSVEDARTTREYLIKVNAFHNGIIYEKDRYLNDIQEKMTRRKWFNRFCGIIGFIGSIASIYSIF